MQAYYEHAVDCPVNLQDMEKSNNENERARKTRQFGTGNRNMHAKHIKTKIRSEFSPLMR